MSIDNFSGQYHFLSNFHPIDVWYQNVIYPSVEHAYQAAKTLDPDTRREVLVLTAGQSKKWGRTLDIRPDWEQVKYLIMAGLVERKFSDKELGIKLVETHPHELIEGNWWGDKYWGVCKGVGENNLGKILMTVRQQLIFGGEDEDALRRYV